MKAGVGELVLCNRQRTRPVNLPLLRRLARHLLETHFVHEQIELSVHLVAAPEMTELNERFLRHAGSTDVITFDYAGGVAPAADESSVRQPANAPPRGRRSRRERGRCTGRIEDSRGSSPSLQGEIFICMDDAVAQARRFRTTWQDEVTRYLIHGLLHLHGRDDVEPIARRAMKGEESRLLREVRHRFPLRLLAANANNRSPRKGPRSAALRPTTPPA